jgi:YVTN family beta-propeller protein
MNKNRSEIVSHALSVSLATVLGVVGVIMTFVPLTVRCAANPANTVLNVVPTAPFNDGNMVVSPNSESLYVAACADTPFASELLVINTQFGTITAAVPLFNGTVRQSGAIGIAVTPDGTTVFVSNSISGSVSVIDAATNSVITTLTSPTIGPVPAGLAVSPDGKELWVANSGKTPLFDNGTVTVIELSDGLFTPTDLINTGGSPNQVVFGEGGGKAYVLNAGPSGSSGFVDKVDVRTHDIINPNLGLGILDYAPSFGMALAIGESTLYVNNFIATINNLDCRHGTLDDTILVFLPSEPPSAQGLGQVVVTPDLKFLYIGNWANGDVVCAKTKTQQAERLAPINMPVAGAEPYFLAAAPNGKTLYVSNNNVYSGSGGPKSITVIDIAP